MHWLPLVDEVIVMHAGRISERGSYEELVSHDGPFAQFLKTYLTETAGDGGEEDAESEYSALPLSVLYCIVLIGAFICRF